MCDTTLLPFLPFLPFIRRREIGQYGEESANAPSLPKCPRPPRAWRQVSNVPLRVVDNYPNGLAKFRENSSGARQARAPSVEIVAATLALCEYLRARTGRDPRPFAHRVYPGGLGRCSLSLVAIVAALDSSIAERGGWAAFCHQSPPRRSFPWSLAERISERHHEPPNAAGRPLDQASERIQFPVDHRLVARIHFCIFATTY
jgi:hypothetical protein